MRKLVRGVLSDRHQRIHNLSQPATANACAFFVSVLLLCTADAATEEAPPPLGHPWRTQADKGLAHRRVIYQVSLAGKYPEQK